MKTETTGCIKRRVDDRVVAGERMVRCLDDNKFALPALAKLAGVPLYAVRSAYVGLTITRLQWRRIAGALRIPV